MPDSDPLIGRFLLMRYPKMGFKYSLSRFTDKLPGELYSIEYIDKDTGELLKVLGEHIVDLKKLAINPSRQRVSMPIASIFRDWRDVERYFTETEEGPGR